MEMFSTLLAFGEGNPPVTGGFPSQRASNDFFIVSLSKLLDRRSICWWFETPLHPYVIEFMYNDRNYLRDTTTNPRDTTNMFKTRYILLNSSAPQCRIYASVNRVSMGLDNALLSIRRQTII